MPNAAAQNKLADKERLPIFLKTISMVTPAAKEINHGKLSIGKTVKLRRLTTKPIIWMYVSNRAFLSSNA
jgi:hypothetical protein